MVTSNKLPDKKIVKMTEQNNTIVVPQRTLLGEVNEHITCPLCRGYYIDATTIVECLHSFCRSCIIKHLQVKSYCPVCEMMINSAKPNIKPDKALQDIVYKLVPGLFQKEMERRQQFYSSRPGPAASATPEQRGEDTERIIFSPEDVISFSLEYSDATDADSISSKSSDSNEELASSRRFLQCPAVVNVSHLKKFLSMKFDIDSTQFAIDILYKRVPLPDYYTLMDIAYIYNWKRNEPMRFFYQIIDYVAIRNRLFDINRKGSHYRDRKSSPANTEDTNVSSPAPNMNANASEASETSGTDSPMPGDNVSKQANDTSKKNENPGQQGELKGVASNNKICSSPSKKSDDDVEKSQFLNSFELTAKNSGSAKSPVKSNAIENNTATDLVSKPQITPPKVEDTLKRKYQTQPIVPAEIKKLRIELEKAVLPNISPIISSVPSSHREKSKQSPEKEIENKSKNPPSTNSVTSSSISGIEMKPQMTASVGASPQVLDSLGAKRPVPGPQIMSSAKRKNINDTSLSMPPPPAAQKTVSSVKLQVPKIEPQSSTSKPTELLKPAVKKIPDLKPTNSMSQSGPSKTHPVNKVRMDLLANNSDPTIDRSKILSQVKTSLNLQNTSQTGQTSGDPLKSLFDSCKINIPSSLSITLTDQKLESRNPSEAANVDSKKTVVNKNLTSASTASAHKVPSPPVHNYIEILKLPDSDPKKQNKPENGNSDVTKPNKSESTTTQSKPPGKSPETSAKGPVPNLKPIDTKSAKQSANFVGPITFQQTFEQQLQSLQSDKKPKLPKNKTQVPKLMLANPKTFNAANKLNPSPINKPNAPAQSSMSTQENKTSAALDLSTPHNIQSNLSPHQTKAFETMQSIANLAKKQNLPLKGTTQTMSQSFASLLNRPQTTAVGTLRVPPTGNHPQSKLDKINPSGMQTNNSRPEIPCKTNQIKPASVASPTMSSASYQMSSMHSPSTAQPSPRSQTRSPSSSPKLVIAEEKQITNSTEQNINQSNQITSTQLSGISTPKGDNSKVLPGPSKPGLKPMKPLPPVSKIPGLRQPITQTVKSNPTQAGFQLLAHQELLRHQMEMNAWLTAHRQFDVYKNMSNIAHHSQNDFNNKDK